MRRPNIIYLHSHDTGRYVQPYGYAVPTPRIQGLAEEGVLFRQAFCAASSCSASRACLLTGQYAHCNGMLGLAHRGWTLNDYGHHIIHTLRGAGYSSALIGEQHISRTPDVIGYDRVVKIETTHVDDVAPVTIDILSNPPPQPFFLSVGFFETHREFFEPLRKEDAYARPPANLPDIPETRRDMAAFVASARTLDRGMGAVLDAIDRFDLASTTLVICTTDHGIPFPGAKATMSDRGVGVMLIMRGPGPFAGGKILDGLVSQIDLYPTLCDLLEIPQPNWLQGVSLMPLAVGQASEVRGEVFAEGTYHAAYEPQRMIRTDRWKYVRRFDHRTRPVLPNTDDSPSKDVWMRMGWAEEMLQPEQLYDLLHDPNEAANLIGRPDPAGITNELRERLERWMRDTEDPLLEGPVPPPPGAEFNDPDEISPSSIPQVA
ncbi:MAG: sulfatase family protein [Gaiellales bacterium]